MTACQIKYAYLKGQTWIYRRNYPNDVRIILGSQALKQSLKTGDTKLAQRRAIEVNAAYETTVQRARDKAYVALEASRIPSLSIGAIDADASREEVFRQASEQTAKVIRSALSGERIRVDPVLFKGQLPVIGDEPVNSLARFYLLKRARELQPGGYKSVRFSVDLFSSKYGERTIGSLGRKEGKEFISAIACLSRMNGKYEETRQMGLDQLVAFSKNRQDLIKPRTQKRIFSQVNHFLDWAVYEGLLLENPFKSVRIEAKIIPAPYAVPTDREVKALLAAADPQIRDALLFCLLSGMRSGEAVGLLREDLRDRGNLGVFALIRPNRIRSLKTSAAERVVPLHSALQDRLPCLPDEGALFPDLTVPIVTKAFAALRGRLGLSRPGLVFHSTRKWFITQCERTGAPEHWTASIVGHQSARSENRLTYAIYSAGITDEQKRSIVEAVQLPT